MANTEKQWHKNLSSKTGWDLRVAHCSDLVRVPQCHHLTFGYGRSRSKKALVSRVPSNYASTPRVIFQDKIYFGINHLSQIFNSEAVRAKTGMATAKLAVI